MIHLYVNVNQSSISRFLEQAALSDKRRNSFIYKALHTFLQNENHVSSAFIWKNNERETTNIVAVGLEEAEIFKWLRKSVSDLIDFSFNIHQLRSPLPDFPITVFPTWNHDEITGIWLIWSTKILSKEEYDISFVFPYLEAITIIDQPKQISLDDDVLNKDLIEAFQNKDPSALVAVLSLFRVIGGADLVYWGDVEDNTIAITAHLGSKHDGFGFELPVGKGFGGRAAQMKNMLAVNDYQNSPYRVQKISRTIDQEGLRSGLVFPLKDKQVQASGLLYVTRREMRPFSLIKQLTLQRTVQKIEPLHQRPATVRAFFTTNRTFFPLAERKGELRKLVEKERHIVALEKWASEVTKGTVLTIDSNGIPYNPKQMNNILVNEMESFPLIAPTGGEYGKLLVSTTIPLQQSDWPDFMEDLISACRIILERQLLLYQTESAKYTHWLQTVTSKEMDEDVYYNALRLGLPVDEGEVWILTWAKETELPINVKIQFEELALKRLRRKILFSNHFALILLDSTKEKPDPELFRNELLEIFPTKIRLIFGATYDSFADLKEALDASLKWADNALKEESSNFTLEIKRTGLDILYKKGRIRQELEVFAVEILQPILDYDKKHHTTFTETLVYHYLLQSPEEVARQLFIHKNTVLYRVKRAKDILDINTEIPKNRIALELAAYQWIKQDNPSFLGELNSRAIAIE